ncbi:MAG: citrate lyase acyl carrier protein, partial [Deltaproteobacteria bacterium]|nr:citrate lyase acyl carrier protein [Deltaproteobacteria bacterium]
MAAEVKRYEAGRQGDDVRSDLHVAFEPADDGGLRVDLDSRVAAYYGDSIRAQADAVASALGVGNGRVAIDDKGGLPFVIAARI